VYLPRTMISFVDFAHTLILPQDLPCGKPQGILKLKFNVLRFYKSS
jgi:hypothetical protein